MEQKKEILLEIENLCLSFRRYDKGVVQKELQVISDLHLQIKRGEIVAVVGSSGSGKSLLVSAVLGILPQNSKLQGRMYYKGQILTPKTQEQLRGQEIAYVPQSVSYLDPLMKVGAQVEGHKKPRPVEKRKDLFQRLQLPRKTERMYPFQLSGGMARRVLVSTALLTEAELILADEPTPGMSLEQALEALKILREMAEAGRGVLLITHDLDLALSFAHRIAVFYAGTTVETALVSDFKKGEEWLRHPYSKALWKALPQNGFESIGGFQPFAKDLPSGCLFEPRCPHRTEKCKKEAPPRRKLRGGEVRCYYAT